MLIDITYEELERLVDYVTASYDMYVTEVKIQWDGYTPSPEVRDNLKKLAAFASLAAKIVHAQLVVGDQPECLIPEAILQDFKRKDDLDKNFLNY